MEYQATFGIDCGVSYGFGLKSPDYEKREEIVIADDNMNAIIAATKKAIHFSRDYLSNPQNDFTTVTLLELYDSKRGLINQKEVLEKAGFTGIKRFEWSEDKLVIKCHMLEHLLPVVFKSAPDK